MEEPEHRGTQGRVEVGRVEAGRVEASEDFGEQWKHGKTEID
jgi:hypothetical protein